MTSFNTLSLNGSTLTVNGTDYNLSLAQTAEGTDSSLSSFKGIAAVDNGDDTITLTVGENSVRVDKQPPVTHLQVEKKTLATVYDPDTQMTYNNESCLGICAEIPANGSIDVEFDGVTKSLTNSSASAATQTVWFGTHFGVSDSTTAISGDLYIRGNHTNFGVATYNQNTSTRRLIGCITAVDGFSFSVTSIRSGAFSVCSKLTTVNIPDGVTSIGTSAFESCSTLTSVTIPDSVTSIGSGAFSGCPDALFEIVGDVKYIGKWAITVSNTSITSAILREGAVAIADSAFSSRTNLASVTIPNSVTSIGHNAFYRCTNLTSVSIGNGVTSIGNNAFDGDPIASDIYLTNVATIGTGAFGQFSPTAPIHIYPSLSSANKIFNIAAATTAQTASLYFHITWPDRTQFAVSDILPVGSQKAAITYNIYTDNDSLRQECMNLGDQYTTVNVYKLDGGEWD